SLVQGERNAGPPSSIYVRAGTDRVAEVQSLLAPTANPEAPDEVNVSQPSDALTARAAAAGAFDSLFLGLGVVALIVGAVGVANLRAAGHRAEDLVDDLAVAKQRERRETLDAEALEQRGVLLVEVQPDDLRLGVELRRDRLDLGQKLQALAAGGGVEVDEHRT